MTRRLIEVPGYGDIELSVSTLSSHQQATSLFSLGYAVTNLSMGVVLKTLDCLVSGVVDG